MELNMKKGISVSFLTILFLLGISVMLYPALSRLWNRHVQSRAIADYTHSCENLSGQDSHALFRAAENYNAALNQLPNPLLDFRKIDGYNDLLNPEGNGVMGYLFIDKIAVVLPVYHGTAQSVLQIAAGHLQGSSLPTGGRSTHCVISAHSGMPGARLFTDLALLEVGDTFSLTVLDRVLTYRVDEIHTVEPQNREFLGIHSDADLCTLMTCTPYGINSHRLLVRGSRTEETEGAALWGEG